METLVWIMCKHTNAHALTANLYVHLIFCTNQNSKLSSHMTYLEQEYILPYIPARSRTKFETCFVNIRRVRSGVQVLGCRFVSRRCICFFLRMKGQSRTG